VYSTLKIVLSVKAFIEESGAMPDAGPPFRRITSPNRLGQRVAAMPKAAVVVGCILVMLEVRSRTLLLGFGAVS
jgi:hypothetical protein